MHHFPSKIAILPFSDIFQRLTVPQKLTNLGAKGAKRRKRKDVSYQLLQEFFQKYFVAQERSAVKNSFSTYIWSKVDSCFCEAVYLPLILLKYLSAVL